jgi:hypothetical protein
LQLLHARLRSAQGILFEIESGQITPPIWERDNPTSYQELTKARDREYRRRGYELI